MLDIQFIRNNADIVKKTAVDKNISIDIDRLLVLDSQIRELTFKIDELRHTQKSFNQDSVDEARKNKEELKTLESKFADLQKEFIGLMRKVPNIPTDDTPVGKNESENKVLRQVGEKPTFNFTPKEHWQLGESLGLIDNESASKISGARFTYLKGDLALLQFALISYTLSILTDEQKLKEIASKANIDVPMKPFIPVVPPVFIRPEVMDDMGRLEPKEERYHIPSDDLYLVGSAEHTLGPLHMNQTLKAEELPVRYVGYSTAFRREAGSYGKDTKGILRLHQFDKLEMESFTGSKDSIKEQDFIVAIQEYLVSSLGLAYQIVLKCTGDMGEPDARAIDIETWMPGQNTYRETHTSDLMTDYQARRLKTRIKAEDGSTEFAHMNDATAFAIGRIIIAIMENYQQEDGTITVPKSLVPYLGKEKISHAINR